MTFLMQTPGIDWTQFGVAAGVIFVVFIFLMFLLKAFPGWLSSWREVRLAEISVREKEAEARSAQATSFGQLSDALKSMSDVLNNVAVEQRHATEDVRLLQRVNADVSSRTEETINHLVETVANMSDRIESIERLVKK